jgi:hypothetical protein
MSTAQYQRERKAARQAADVPRACEWCGEAFQPLDLNGVQRFCSLRCMARATSPRVPLADRFWAKVDRRGPDDCWIWLGAKISSGYGTIYFGGKVRIVLAHRVAFELEVGPIPDGLELDHLCFERACVNPAHLEPVTKQENLRREAEHQRAIKAVA